MISGEPPFKSASPRELLNLQCTAEPPPFGEEIEAPAGVCELVFALLAKSPDERPQSADDVLAALAPFRVGKKRKGGDAQVPSSKRARPAASASSGAVTPSGTLRSAKRVDTVALLEKVSAPREIRGRTGVIVILAASILSGALTYGIRAHYARAKWATPQQSSALSQR
jgi:serine/threonine-protein kinase